MSGTAERIGEGRPGGVRADVRAGVGTGVGARSVAPACLAMYVAVVVGLLLAILHCNGGVFTYSLDDPYIHLALAENLAHGHYGINAGEASSPSSSIVWPLLLTPFARWGWAQYVPLALNALFCGMGAWLIGRLVDGLGPATGASVREDGDAAESRANWLMRLSLAVALMLVSNLAGLTFVGMEHGLQVLLALACAVGMVRAFDGEPIPGWCLAAAVLGPLVRYENFALVAAMALVLWAQRGRGSVLRLAGASVVGPVLFSVFLLSRGLPAVPSSVMVKASAYSLAGGGRMAALRSMYWGPIGTLREWGWYGQLAVALALLWLAVRERTWMRRWVLAGALVAAGLQLAVGRVNWFHRYEVYALAFTAVIAVTALVETTRIPRWAVLAGLLAVAFPGMEALWKTPAAAENIYLQQYQMHRFVADFYGKTVAVNDLGWVSYGRPAGVYVLDLWGLASPEAARRVRKDADWLNAITAEHGAGLAILYPGWYPEGAPDQWEPLGTMCIQRETVSVAESCVVFYRTEVGDKPALEREMAAFAHTLPAGVTMTLGQDTSDQ